MFAFGKRPRTHIYILHRDKGGKTYSVWSADSFTRIRSKCLVEGLSAKLGLEMIKKLYQEESK